MISDVEDDGRTEEKSGTGMGDGDTSQAKDVTDTLDDQDQLLKGDQKAEENTNQADAPDNKPKGTGLVISCVFIVRYWSLRFGFNKQFACCRR